MLRRYAGANIAIAVPFADGLKVTFTFWPMRTLSRSQSTMLVIMERE